MRLYIGLVFLLSLLFSCADASKTSLGSLQFRGKTVQVYADAPLKTGLNTITIKDLAASNAHLLLTQNNVQHTFALQPSDKGAHQANIFIVDAAWEAGITIEMEGESSSALILTNIKDIIPALSFEDEGATVFLEITAPIPAEYGNHPFHFALYRNDDAFQLSKTTAYTVIFRPWMQMNEQYGHSSNFNEQPIANPATSMYEGKITYSMPGTWEIQFTIMKNGETIATPKKKVMVIRKG